MFLLKGKNPEHQREDFELKNPRDYNKILKFICCLNYIQKPSLLKNLNILYICFVYAIQLIVILQGIIFAVIAERVAEKVEAVHYMLVIVIISGYVTNQLYNYSNLDEAWKIMKYAYNNFNGEINEEQKKIHREGEKKDKRMYMVFTVLMTGSSAGYLSFAPVREAISGAEKSLPIPMYVPFDPSRMQLKVPPPCTRNSCFHQGMSLLFAYCPVFIFGTLRSRLAYMGTLNSELKLLNYSILHLEERAAKKSGIDKVTKETWGNAKFQDCMYSCLREDVIHHHLILRYYNLTKSYLGFIFLMYILVASVILAAAGYLLARPNSPLDETIKFVCIVMSEMLFIFLLCWYAEIVSDESSKLYHNLFGGPWYECKKQFKDSLNIMLCGTLKPIQLKTNLFSIAASLETYNSVVTTSFQYFNLLRNMQSI